MKCPDCGVEMNHHADKLVYPEQVGGRGAREVVAEFHTCPKCGKTHSRVPDSPHGS